MASPIEAKLTRYYNGDAITDTLNGSAITLTQSYNPKAGDGGDDITESIPIFLSGAKATVIASITSINQMILAARQRAANGYGDRVYIEARSDGAGAWRRSEIIDGRLNVTDTGIETGLTSGVRTEAELIITRRGWWEDTAGTFLPIYNSNGTTDEATDWIDVFNCADASGSAPAKRENWVKLASAGISGDLPAPVTTWIKEATLSFDVQSIYVGKVVANYAGAALAMADYLADFSGTSDANCSGGAYQAAAISTDAETELFSASIGTTAAALQLGGAPYHIMARFRDNSSFADVRLRLKILSGTTVVWNGSKFMLASTTALIQELGVVNLPPGLASEHSSFTLKLYGERLTGDTETINLDFWQYFGGEFVKLYQITAGAYDLYKYGGPNNSLTRYDDHYLTAPFMDMVGYGAPSLTVEPGKEHAFLFLVNGTSTAPIANNMEIRMEYRPRWSSPI